MRCRSPLAYALFPTLAALAFAAAPVRGSDEFEQEPIRYSSSVATDVVAQLQACLSTGKAALRHDEQTGYLPSLLKVLKVPVSSQTLVFSKTSFQRERISPRTPRALYFNDDVYVGYVPGGDMLEIAAADPLLGTTFYTLDQDPAVKPRLVRQTDSCLQCHAGPMTRDLPGLVLRSVFPDPRGQPILTAGTFLVNHETPFKQRWGGWYVTGTHGQQRHMGNVLMHEGDDPDTLDTDDGANLTDLTKKFDASAYLTGHSDIVALLVMEHQAQMHNLIGRAGILTRFALRDERVMNEALGRPADFRSDSTTSRIRSACEPLVKYMLMSSEAPLTERVRGTTTFASDYAGAGPRDGRGRSLRELDLERRLFKHPCSPLIYSTAFDGLPEPAKAFVNRRLFEVLSGKDDAKEFAHLSTVDRRAILEILRDTKRGLPAEWKPR